MSERSLRGKVAVVGIGETTYYKHSMSPDPEFVLATLDHAIRGKPRNGLARIRLT